MDEQILAARRVLSSSQLLVRDLPTFVAGMTYSAELRLIDSQGVKRPESGAAGYEPRLLLTVNRPGGGPPLQLVEVPFASFSVITESAVPVGWSFSLALTSVELADYLGANQEAMPLALELYLTKPGGALVPLYVRETSIRPGSFNPAYS